MHIRIVALFIGIISFVLFSCSPPSDSNGILPDFVPANKIYRLKPSPEIQELFKIPLSKNLSYNPQASQELLTICKKYDDMNYHSQKCMEFNQWAESNKNKWRFDTEEYNDFIKIIKKYPDSTSALTAKLRIRFITWIRNKITEPYLIELLEEIKNDCPNAWQAIYATKEIGLMRFPPPLSAKDPLEVQRGQLAIEYHLKHLDEYRKLDKETDPEFLQMRDVKEWKHWDEGEYAFSAEILSAMACWAGEFMHDYEQGIKLATRVITEYPGTWAAECCKYHLESSESSLRGEKLRKWFESTYGRLWTSKELNTLISFNEKFEKENGRGLTIDEKQEFLKKLMSDTNDKQDQLKQDVLVK